MTSDCKLLRNSPTTTTTGCGAIRERLLWVRPRPTHPPTRMGVGLVKPTQILTWVSRIPIRLKDGERWWHYGMTVCSQQRWTVCLHQNLLPGVVSLENQLVWGFNFSTKIQQKQHKTPLGFSTTNPKSWPSLGYTLIASFHFHTTQNLGRKRASRNLDVLLSRNISITFIPIEIRWSRHKSSDCFICLPLEQIYL